MGGWMASQSPERGTAATPSLRDRVLRHILAWFGIGAVVTGGLILAQASIRGEIALTMMIGAGGLFGFPLLSLLQRQLDYRRCALVFLLYLFGVCTYFQCFRGLTAGTVLGSVALLMVSGMLFEAQGVVWAFALSLLSLIISAALVLGGWVEPWQTWFWDPGEALVWLRYAVVFVSFGGGLASALVLLIRGYEQSERELAATLEREREERRQREIVQRALNQAQRIDAVGQFAAGMAHDFNNTLAVITSGANVIRALPRMPREVLELTDEIVARAQVGSESLRQLLSLGRDDIGKPARVGLESVVHRSLATLREAVGPNVQVHVDSSSCADVAIDVARLQQALLNLAFNARDAMPEGGSWTLRVSERHVSELPAGWAAERGVFVCLECADTGSGMDAAVLDRIFEPFFTTKEPGKGTGLGLPMVRKTVLDASGFIETSSATGRGTSFKLHFPVVHTDGVSTRPPSAAAPEIAARQSIARPPAGTKVR